MKKKTTDTLHVWGQAKAKKQETNIEYKDTVFMQEKLSQDVKSSSPYVRLKIVMDYWCSLWFWPIEKAEFLPTRAEFLHDISLLVEKRDDIIMNFDKNLFSDTIDDEIRAIQMTELGFIDVAEQIEKNERLQVVQEVSSKQKFLHWELEFADVFAKKGGFDLILGNPPWLLVRWEEFGLMSEFNPLFDIRKLSLNKLDALRIETFNQYTNIKKEYISEYESSEATQVFLNSVANYPTLQGMKANLYKCFLPLGWKLSNNNGTSGFLHPEGVYDDPKGGALRTEIYKRLKYHFQFQNGKNLFEIAHRSKYSINIFNNLNKKINFINIANLFLPHTIDSSFQYSGNEIVEGIKDNENNWNIKGHTSRIVNVDSNILKLFARLYDDEGTVHNEARLPAIHSVELISVLSKLSTFQNKNELIKNKIYPTPSTYWNINNAMLDNHIFRKTNFENIYNLIIEGPHFFVGNPVYKTPRHTCTEKGDYDIVDLNIINDDYLARSNYIPNPIGYEKHIPSVNFNNESKKIIDYFRLAARKMIGSASERTLITTVIPKNVAHTFGVISFTYENYRDLLATYGGMCSVVVDFFIKSTGASNFGNNNLLMLPLIYNALVFNRILSLSCLTSHYKELYEEQYNNEVASDSWTKKDDPRLNDNFFKNLTATWQRDVALRTDYERRQALVEIDVLVSQELKLTLEELKTIYRIQFPVLKQNENETFYDMNGRIVFTVSKGLTGVGLPRKADKKATPYKIVIEGKETEEKPLGWEDIKDMQEGEIHRIIQDDTMPNGPIDRTIIYKAPFVKCDREKDYEIAWVEFEKRRKR